MQPFHRISRCLPQAQRLQGWSVDGRSNGQSVVSLISCQRPACLRTKVSIDRSRIISLFLQCDLDVHDDPIWGQIAIAVNRSVVRIVRVRVVTPGWIPVASVPVPPPAQHKHNARVVTYPPRAVMPYSVVIVKRSVVRATETIAPSIVDDADVSIPIHRHVARESEISLPVHCQVVASSGASGLRNSFIARFCWLHAAAPQSVRPSEISLAINRRTVTSRHRTSCAACSCRLYTTVCGSPWASDGSRPSRWRRRDGSLMRSCSRKTPRCSLRCRASSHVASAFCRYRMRGWRSFTFCLGC